MGKIIETIDMIIKTAILTVSTRGSKGERTEDTSGAAVKEIMARIGGKVVDYRVIPDEKNQIIAELRRMADIVKAELILTTGGTGFSPSDITPEATLEVIHKRVPGFEEAMRMQSFATTPHAILSRAVAGIYQSSLIINLPGSPKGVRENLEVILEAIPHGIKVLRGGLMHDPEHQFNPE